MADTTIEWTSKVWNPIRGCSLVSQGCRSCYAMKQAYRFSGPCQPYEGLVRMGANGPVWTGRLREVPEKLGEPLSWRKPVKIFVNSMSDLFHSEVSNEFIAAVFAVMAASPRHTYQILTKRPERALAWFASVADDPADKVSAGLSAIDWDEEAVCAVANYINGFARWSGSPEDGNPLDGSVRRWPLPNVHLGVSIEDQSTADERLPLLSKFPTVVPWVSYEPALGPVDFGRWMHPFEVSRDDEGNDLGSAGGGSFIGWLVCGGESGTGARPMHPSWARGARDQCDAAAVPFFFKQWGAYEPMTDAEAWSSYMVTESDDLRGDSKGVVILHPDGTLETSKPTREWWTLCDEMLAPDPQVDDPGFLEGPVAMHKVGKAIAGRELDGRTWDEFPVTPALTGGPTR